jgi:glycosyltransferase involved in cell wall biosynthesis
MANSTNQLKVVFITRKWPPAVGGMETYSVELASELERRVSLQTIYLPGREGGATPSKQAILGFFFKAVWAIVKSNRVDVFHVGDMAMWPLAFAANILKPKSRSVISAHGTDVAFGIRPGFAPKVYNFYLGSGAVLLGRRTTVIANSTPTAGFCTNAGYRNVKVVPLGTFAKTDVTSAAVALPKYVLFVGRLAVRKGLGWFTREVLRLLPSDISVKVAGSAWDASETQAIQGNPRVELLGPVYGDELATLRLGAVAVIMPNITLSGRDFEGFGLTAIEASAVGAVLVASAVDGIVDAVREGETGFLIAEGKPKSWADKIVEIASWPPAKRLAFVQNAQQVTREYYSWSRVAEDCVRIYRD